MAMKCQRHQSLSDTTLLQNANFYHGKYTRQARRNRNTSDMETNEASSTLETNSGNEVGGVRELEEENGRQGVC